MSLTNLQYLGTVLLANIDTTYGTEVLQSFIDQEGNVKLAQAAAYETEASKIMFAFKAGETSADKSKYAANLIKLAKQIREDNIAYGGEISSVVSWSGSAADGTASLQDFVDEDYNAPTF